MTIIDVKDGGLARNETYGVTVGVIHLVVAHGDAAPETITGWCKKEIKDSLIRLLKREITWEI